MVNLITEIPKMSKAKMEVNTKDENNPIAQDIKKGKLRDYHGPIFWNYGCVPQTWENVKEEHPVLKCFGDDDPVDVVEIGTAALAMGSVTAVKPLGVRQDGCRQPAAPARLASATSPPGINQPRLTARPPTRLPTRSSL